MNNKLYVVNEVRFCIFLSVISILLVFVFLRIFSSGMVYASFKEINYEIVHIAEGDNLWNIAILYNNKNYDVRKIVYEIEKINNLENAQIYPGDKIKIPIY